MGGSGGPRKGTGGMKGVPKQKTHEMRMDLLATLRAKKFDPAAALVEIHFQAMDEYRKRVDPVQGVKGFGGASYLAIAQSSASDLLEYVYPKLARTEVTGPDGSNLFSTLTDIVRQIANEAKK